MAGKPELKRIDVTIDDGNFQPGTLEVMQVLRPEWKKEDIQFKVSPGSK